MSNIFHMFAGLLVVCLFTVSANAQTIQVQDGQTIAFLGDSITQFGTHNGCGYVRLVGLGLEANGIKTKRVGAGISGHKSNQMLARLEKDVLSKKPDWMTLSCGVNDVWHGKRGVNLEDYKKNITQIVDQALAANIKVMILTSTMIREQEDNDLNKKLAPYNDFLRALAKQKKCHLADLYVDMVSMVNAAPQAIRKTGNVATIDGVHMNPLGDEMMAIGILKTFGLTDAQLQKAKTAWRTEKNKSNIRLTIGLSIEEYEAMRILAGQSNMSFADFIKSQIEKTMQATSH